MKNYCVVIEETVSDNFTVLATTAEEALEFAAEKYRSAEFVLEPGYVTLKQITIFNDNVTCEWIRF